MEMPRGVKIRGQKVQIAFTYKNQQCRELLPQTTITPKTIKNAETLRNEILRKIELNTFVYSEYFPNSQKADLLNTGAKKILMSVLLERQAKTYLTQVERGTIAKSTAEGYIKAIKSDRMGFWINKYVSDCTPAMLREWVRSLNVTSKFARNLMTPLRSVFEDALNDELIKENPMDRIALTKLLRETSTTSTYAVDPFTATERQTLIEAARPDEKWLVQFWFNTGLRPGELIALRWSRINTLTSKAHIDLNLVSGVEKGPKTAAGLRDVDLNTDALAALEAQKNITFATDSHVFNNPRTSKPFTHEAQIRKTLWDPLCTRAGVRYRNPYQIRHTYASSQLTTGANPWYIAQQLGHVDVQMVYRTYGKFIASDYQRPRIEAQSV